MAAGCLSPRQGVAGRETSYRKAARRGNCSSRDHRCLAQTAFPRAPGIIRSCRTAPRAKHGVLPLVLSPILLAQEHISADFPDYPVSRHAPDMAKPWLLALAGHERVKVAVTQQQSFSFRLDQDQGGQGRTPRIYYNAAPPYRTVREARLTRRTILTFR